MKKIYFIGIVSLKRMLLTSDISFVTKRTLVMVLASCILSACQSAGRYTQSVDSKPQFDYGQIDLSDAVPRYEQYRTINSRPYTVLGKSYTPMLEGKGYAQQGQASWYGQKFHGHTTSNGEVYDMFAMTAAHKTLPLPSYVKVTNLSNQKTAILRVNDRGPFHANRIIDLSYAAAKKLDVLKTGVADVKVEVIHIDQNGFKTVGLGPTVAPDTPISIAIAAVEKPKKELLSPVDTRTTTDLAIAELTPPSKPIRGVQNQRFIQIAAVSMQSAANELTRTLSQMYQVEAQAPLISDLYRVRLGPIKNEQKAEKLIESLKENGFDNAFQVLIPAD